LVGEGLGVPELDGELLGEIVGVMDGVGVTDLVVEGLGVYSSNFKWAGWSNFTV